MAQIEDPHVEDEYVADVIVVGAGISGINFGYRLQTLAQKYSYVILEQRENVGGTWDFFKFPGIRSDSDLSTFGFEFKPWIEPEQIAKGPLIVKYMKETAREFGIDKKIRFRHKVLSAEWSSESSQWTLTVLDTSDGGASGTQRRLVCKFVVWGSGYYSYDEGLKADLPGLTNFKGDVLHPQFWPENFDYEGKRVLVVGSGATAITLVPAMSVKAKSVTMLQRSPSYIQTLPMIDRNAATIRKTLGEYWAHQFLRIKFALVAWLWYTFCMLFPSAAKWLLKKSVIRQLKGTNIPFEPHFKPRYNPWEQRMCITPDGDFFAALRKGNCHVVTDHIDTFTENGVSLKSGEKLETDVVVTATGLQVRMFGGAKMFIDGTLVDVGKKHVWKGTMLDGVPNAVIVIGYANASWTLGSDLCAQMTCGILNDMLRRKCGVVVAKLREDDKLDEVPVLPLSSTYVKAGAHALPKSSSTKPWVSRQSFFSDMIDAKFSSYGDRLHFLTRMTSSATASAGEKSKSL